MSEITDNTVSVHEQTPTLSIGDVVEGVIVEINGTTGVDLNGRIGSFPPEHKSVAVGERTHVLIEAIDDDVLTVSSEKGEKVKLWDWIRDRIEDGSPVKAEVVSAGRGGYSVIVNSLYGQLSEHDLNPSRTRNPEVGDVFEVQITQYRDRKNQLIVSERALVEGSLEERKEALLSDLEVGQVLTAEVRRFAQFGAFVDLGGLDALLHIKDMAWRRINHPSDVTRLGEVITVQVLDFDRETEKVSVGLRQMTPDPWLSAQERYTTGLKLTGRVVGMSKFGAFVMLDDGIEGLVHVTEMSWTEKVKAPKEAVQLGDEVECWVLRCEVDRRRLGLTMRDPDNNPWLAIREVLPIGTERDFVISKVVDFGIFVELEGGLEGLIHVSDFSWAVYTGEPTQDYQAGETVRALMLDIDEERGRANLGIKQLCADLTTELMQKYQVGQRVAATVISIQDNGLYVSICDGLEGVVTDGPDALSIAIDDVVEVEITVNDVDAKRLELKFLSLGSSGPGEVEVPPSQDTTSETVAEAAAVESTEAVASVQDESAPEATADDAQIDSPEDEKANEGE